jgi:glycosyltransferase involved in cell wall biosynthesis/2-polyprenyl-3-methyl-5-hydroxy-6-metoxy-1,4-benzoquinol methylase
VLAESFAAHHPDGQFTVLIVDDEGREFDDSREPFTCLRLSEIGLQRAEIGQLAGIYDVTELSTAVKPPFLRHLLKEQSDVIYLDPDIRIYRSLERASSLAREHGLVLTPHMTAPLPRDGRRIDEFHILAAGVYNLGFIAVGAQSGAFIDWWWQKTQRDALSDPGKMMFTDQRWVDFVPSLFDHFILKDTTFNVAYWNLHSRDLTWIDGQYYVDGRPLTFFHFSGLDARKPYLLSKHQGDRPRILLSDRPALARICREYLESVERAGFAEQSRVPYGWNLLPSGIRFDLRMRRLYRQGLQAFEEGKGPEPPNPFDPAASDHFIDWLNEPVVAGLRPRVSRYLNSIYLERPDLQRAFPDLAGADWPRYAEWLHGDGVLQLGIPVRLLPVRETAEASRPHVVPSQLTEGVTIAGYFRAEVGVGEAARLLTSAVEAAGIPHSTVTYGHTLSRKGHEFLERGDGRARHFTNIVCVNADQTPAFSIDAGQGFFDGRYTVGYWFWELEQFPPLMHRGFDFVDEVWTATDFVAQAVRAPGLRPVHTVPLPVPIPTCSPDVSRASLGLPTSFMFLFMFDFFSVLERKNPAAVIRAFERAFKPGEGPVLVLKTINGDARLNDLENLRSAAGDRQDILIVDEYFSAEEKNALLGLCDCYVSLHRSEGLGLTMAEAMGLGKPVIGTGYSGNLHFMTAENSYLVDYSTVRVGTGCDPYPADGIWAEPDVDQAAGLMRRVYEAGDEARRKAERGRQDILTRHHVKATAAIVQQRLEAIGSTRTNGGGKSAAAVAAAHGDAAGSAPSLLSSLDQLAVQLTPTPSVAPGRRLRTPLLQAQRLLFKVIRPYWFQQRQIQASLLQAVRQTAEMGTRATNMESAQRQAMQALWVEVHGLRSELAGLQRTNEKAATEVRKMTADVGRELQEHSSRAGRLEADLGALREAVAAFQQNAAKHLEGLTTEAGRSADEVSRLQQRLYATPYMADPSRFTYTNADGQPVLGFRGARHDGAGVYVGFEDVFRGPESLIRDRFRIYLPLLAPHDHVIDLGCGRGELLDVLREAGIAASGVDIDHAMVERCRGKGHTVEHRDALDYLRSQPDGSLPVIFAAQVVEHLPYPQLLEFLELSRRKVRPGGRLIFETVNPHALEAFKTFYTDLTHQKPIFPEVAVALCWLMEFDEAYVFYPNGTGDTARDHATQGEYAVVALKA